MTDFLSASEPYCDPHYAEKVWKQGQELSKEHRQEFLRKVSLFLAWTKSRDPRAGKLWHEIAGWTNDKIMNDYYTPQEKQRRELWLEETGQKEEN